MTQATRPVAPIHASITLRLVCTLALVPIVPAVSGIGIALCDTCLPVAFEEDRAQLD